NAIFSNAGLGINLQGDTDVFNSQPTPNDAGDADTGPNNQQNFPVLGLANSGPAGTVVTGTLNSTPNTTFTLELFASPVGAASGSGGGATPLGTPTVPPDAGGNASFTANFAAIVPVGQVITATATDPNNNTSEFSAWVLVQPDPTASISDATVAEGDSGTAGAVFTVSLSGPSGRAVTVNYA